MPGCADASRLPTLAREPLVDVGKKIVCLGPAFHHLLLRVAHAVMHEQAAVGPVVVELVELIFDLAAGDPEAKVFAGDGFDGMRFVEDQDFVVGQKAGALHAQCEIAEEQGVVDDEDLGIGDSAAIAVIEAVLVVGAGAAHAIAVVAGHLVPDLGQGFVVEVGQGSVGSGLRPSPQGTQLVELRFLREEADRTPQGIGQATEADVIAASLHQYRRELQRHDAAEEGDVLMEQLFLQADGVCGDDHAAAGFRLVFG